MRYLNLAVYALLGVGPLGSDLTPAWVGPLGSDLTPAWVGTMADHNCDCTPACKELGWKGHLPPWEGVVREVVEEYRRQKKDV